MVRSMGNTLAVIMSYYSIKLRIGGCQPFLQDFQAGKQESVRSSLFHNFSEYNEFLNILSALSQSGIPGIQWEFVDGMFFEAEMQITRKTFLAAR